MRKTLSIAFLISSFLSFSFHSNAQNLSQAEQFTFKELEDSLVNLATKMLREPLHTDRTEYGFQFSKALKHTLDLPNSFYYPFKDLEKTIHVVSPEDKSFKIFNWLI